MAFFSVIRYTGDEDDTADKTKKENILQKLHEAAEQRRRSKQLEIVVNDSSEKTSEERSLSKKRKRDPKSLEENEEEIGQKLKKKLKEKKTENEGKDMCSPRKKKQRTKPSEVDIKLDKEICTNIDHDEVGDPETMTEEALPRESSDEEYEEKNVEDEEFASQPAITGPSPKEDCFTVLGEVRAKKQQQVHRVLPEWLEKPTVITDDLRHKRIPFDDVPGVDGKLLERLRENGIKDYFPVQGVLMPELLRSFCYGYLYGNAGFRPSDICCSAPTGSGKTLAYVLPIIQVLSHRVVPQVRALVVLPVRDLVKQVYNVFLTYCKDTNVKVVQISGFKMFSSEQELLVRKGPCGHESQCDILISTPGRLVNHINKTPGFTLKHLRFLVIDEADRMMDEIKHDWLRYVEDAVYSTGGCDEFNESRCPVYGDIRRLPPGPMTASSACKPRLVLQKLLFSATLSQNPEKLQRLNLFQPKLFTSVVQEVHQMKTPEAESMKTTEGEFIGKFTTPAGLTEFFIESDAGQKPLVLIRLIEHLKYRHVLCFTNSVETAHRLYWLIKLTCDVEVREISSRQQNEKRIRILKHFANGKVDVLVSTDALARGMDIDNVRFVVSYDSPTYLKTYIHRAGRTARAGKVGTAITLLEKKEIFRFKQMLKDAGKMHVKEIRVKISEIRPFIPLYTKALEELQHVLQAEVRK